jgi:uncharacterized protein involved in exopolysaccharide biosynthesis
MNNATDHYPAFPPVEEKISFIEAANAVLRKWRVVVVLPVVFALVVGVRSLTQDRTYAASASFTPRASESRAGGGAASLAQQFGVSLGTERAGQSPEFYMQLLRSRTLLRRAVEAQYKVPTGKGGIWAGTLIEYWHLNKPGGTIPSWRQASEILRGKITPSLTRETGVVGVSVSADNPVLAEQIAERLLNLLNEYNLEVRQSRAQEEERFINGRITDAGADLLVAERALQDFLRQNREFRNSPDLMFEHDRLERQVLMRQEVYSSLLRSQEQARIDAVRDTPLITVIDDPKGTGEPEGRGTVQRTMVAFVVGLMLAVIIAFVTEFARRRRETEDSQYREFRGLVREAWGDLLHPARWMRRGKRPATVGDR